MVKKTPDFGTTEMTQQLICGQSFDITKNQAQERRQTSKAVSFKECFRIKQTPDFGTTKMTEQFKRDPLICGQCFDRLKNQAEERRQTSKAVSKQLKQEELDRGEKQ